jgi:hypothetical protein
MAGFTTTVKAHKGVCGEEVSKRPSKNQKLLVENETKTTKVATVSK